jgi:transcriptional regulator with XRE-family HTH domain
MGISQKQLAAVAGTSQQQIQRIVAGNQPIHFDMALRICEALRESLWEDDTNEIFHFVDWDGEGVFSCLGCRDDYNSSGHHRA